MNPPETTPEATVAFPVYSTPEETNRLRQVLYTLVAEQPFFRGLDPTCLQLLTDSAFEMKFEAGQTIFNEGSPANRFYLILAGKVVVESAAKEYGTIVIQTLGPGDDLGWSWLFSPYYLHLSARALEATRTISFFGTRLRQQCEQDHELGYQLMKRIAEVAIKRLGAAQQRLMEHSEPFQLQQ
jgi:CRP-like cAMP-binding protein